MLATGVDDYEWERCWSDYRLGVIRNLFTPVRMYAEGRPLATWWPILERVVVAFQGLECVELLQ